MTFDFEGFLSHILSITLFCPIFILHLVAWLFCFIKQLEICLGMNLSTTAAQINLKCVNETLVVIVRLPVFFVDCSVLTCWSIPTASKPWYIMLTHPSLDANTNRVITAWNIRYTHDCIGFSTYGWCFTPPKVITVL